MNEHPNASNEGRLKVMSEIETCNEKLKVRELSFKNKDFCFLFFLFF